MDAIIAHALGITELQFGLIVIGCCVVFLLAVGALIAWLD